MTYSQLTKYKLIGTVSLTPSLNYFPLIYGKRLKNLLREKFKLREIGKAWASPILPKLKCREDLQW